MFDDNINLFASLKTAYLKIPVRLETTLWWMLAFVFLATLVFFISKRGQQKFSLRRALGYAFPPALYRHRTSRIDILHAFLSVGLWEPFLALLGAVVVGVNVFDLLNTNLGARHAMTDSLWLIVSFQVAISILSIELAFYVVHYCMHKIPWLWSFHRAHHSAEALTFFARYRGHPIELVINQIGNAGIGGLLTGTALYLAGLPLHAATIAAIAAYNIPIFLLNILHHSHVWISFGKLNYVVSAPIMHQLHHSAELHHRDKNLGAVLTIYDWLFGTLYVPKTQETYRWGLNDEEYGINNPHLTLRDFYLEPFRHAWRALMDRRSGDRHPVAHTAGSRSSGAPSRTDK